MTGARELACQVLVQVMDEGEMSHIALREALSRNPGMEGRDRHFVTALVQGTLERLYPIDEKINSVSKTPVKKMKPWIRELLRVSTYQLLYMDSIPPSAVCNEAVKLAVKRKFQGLKGFVNGVLRSIARDPSLPQGNLALEYSQQEWFVEKLTRQYGIENTRKILEGYLEKRPLSIRVNTSKVTAEKLKASWERESIEAEPVGYIENAFYLKGFDSIDRTEAFQKGWIQVQDVSSMLAAHVAAPNPGSRVMDLCAAPGGKSLHLADLVGEHGMVLSCDLTEKKVDLIRENQLRCGFAQIHPRVRDARTEDESLFGTMDVVMADLPCSGLGTMSHKPEIRYRVTPDIVMDLAKLQREILTHAWKYLRPGGVLVYSNCTVAEEENVENFQWLLENTPLEPVSLDPYLPESLRSETTAKGYLQLLPGIHPGCDGFFISKMVLPATAGIRV